MILPMIAAALVLTPPEGTPDDMPQPFIVYEINGACLLPAVLTYAGHRYRLDEGSIFDKPETFI